MSNESRWGSVRPTAARFQRERGHMHQSGRQTLKRNAAAITGGTAGLIVAAGAFIMLRAAFREKYSFHNKSVVITGGSRGLGLELARIFAAEGARLTLLARTAATLEKARMELEQRGARVLAIPCD